MKLIRRIIYKLFQEHSSLQGYVAHTPHGVINVVLAMEICWSIALLFGVGFLVFQYWQKYAGHPVDANDVGGWLLGMSITGLAYWFWG